MGTCGNESISRITGGALPAISGGEACAVAHVMRFIRLTSTMASFDMDHLPSARLRCGEGTTLRIQNQDFMGYRFQTSIGSVRRTLQSLLELGPCLPEESRRVGVHVVSIPL